MRGQRRPSWRQSISLEQAIPESSARTSLDAGKVAAMAPIVPRLRATRSAMEAKDEPAHRLQPTVHAR